MTRHLAAVPDRLADVATVHALPAVDPNTVTTYAPPRDDEQLAFWAGLLFGAFLAAVTVAVLLDRWVNH